ncbi:MAG: carbon-nitrogen hydrolase family protein [Sedimentisphaerales bacterium]|nr:carbon-nitrogen hydrolase family protein [Sedimentisphaerales bacterium]
MVRIGMCQVDLVDGDREGNFVRIEEGIAEAKAKGAEIACFAETAILGWVNPEAHEKAFAIPGADSDRLCELALKYAIHLCAGLAEKDGGDLYDSAVLIGDVGRILLKHRKIILLSELMRPPYTPGGEVAVVESRLGRVGLLICADTHKDEILARMGELTPELVVVPYGYAAVEADWPGHGKELERVVVNAARKTGAVVVGTNSVGKLSHGPWKGRVYGGQSVSAGPNGVILAKCADRLRDIAVFEA